MRLEISLIINVDIIPDMNIDSTGDGEPDINVDTDGDGKPDANLKEITEWKPEKNIDGDFPYDTMDFSITEEPIEPSHRLHYNKDGKQEQHLIVIYGMQTQKDYSIRKMQLLIFFS